MADLTIQEQCGASATISNGVLSITLSEVGLDDANPSSSQIIGALVLKRKQLQSLTASDDLSIGCVVGNPFNSFARNDLQVVVEYSVGLYKVSAVAGIADPDEIVK